jgi:hypothetical protein
MNDEIQPGTRVEVQSTFDRAWKRGFSVEETCRGGYRLRRQSDDSVLPTQFAREVIREESNPGRW